MMRTGILLLLLLVTAACDVEDEFVGAKVSGDYFRVPVGFSGGMAICLRTNGNRCDIRVPPPVVGLNYNDDFISARTAYPSEAVNDYYIIVRLFDSKRADGAQCLKVAADRLRHNRERGGAELDCDSVLDFQAMELRESNCAVRGPFSRSDFEVLRRCTCVPQALGSTGLKCIPDVVDSGS